MNDSSGSITASAGNDNLPVRFSYDAVGRPTTTLDHDNLLLSQVEYHYLRDSTYVVDTIVRHFDIGYGYEAVWLGELVVDSAQTIAWDCSWIHSETGCPGLLQHLCRITVNDTNVVHRAGSSASFEDSGTFPVLVGDTVTIEGMADCAICDTCNTSITVTHVSPRYEYDTRNWVQATSYRDGQNSVASVSYTDGLGRPLQWRVTSHDGVAARTLVTGVGEYDTRGRPTKAYRPYYDLVDPGGLESFSFWDNAMTEVETYYDSDGPGPDCGGFPFGESIYTLEAKSYLTTSAEAGSYWKIGSEHETEYSRSTNVAAKYYELSLTDPDDIQTATRKDHCDNYSKVISTYLDGGTNTLTLQTNYDKLGRETKELISKGVEIDKKVA